LFLSLRLETAEYSYNLASIMGSESHHERETRSAPGDFYVENHCCTSCGIPQVVAPDLVGWVDEGMGRCYWKKQPETPDEMMRAFAVFDSQELGCHRYAGTDPEIQNRVGRENCDKPLSRFSMLGEAVLAHAVRDLHLLVPTEAGWARRIWDSIQRLWS
jgi:hypothetical protein